VPGDEYTASFAIAAPSPVRNIEDFESPHVYHLVFGPSTFATSTAAAHDGTYGLLNHGGKDWIYRDDAAAQVQEGDTISAWVQFHGTADGQAFFAFGANSNIDGSPLATYSLVLAADKHKLYIQENFFGSPLNSTLGTSAQNTRFQANHWYRIQVVWGTNGSILGQLFDSDGTTLLNSVSATASLFSAGGIGFHATGHDKYWDTVTAVFGAGGSGPLVHTGSGTGGIRSFVAVGVPLGDLKFLPPALFVQRSEGIATGPGNERWAAVNGEPDRQLLIALFEALEQQGGTGRKTSGAWAVDWAAFVAAAHGKSYDILSFDW
jgi:hypothetical protein